MRFSLEAFRPFQSIELLIQQDELQLIKLEEIVQTLTATAHQQRKNIKIHPPWACDGSFCAWNGLIRILIFAPFSWGISTSCNLVNQYKLKLEFKAIQPRITWKNSYALIRILLIISQPADIIKCCISSSWRGAKHKIKS